jgi:hypothetical protein
MSALGKTSCVGLLAIVGFFSIDLQAGPFVLPPETAPGWQTSAPYQRNIDMDFSVTPVGTPGSGIPGAVYAGSLDPSLKAGDYVSTFYNVTWFPSLSGFSQTGLVGIDNRAGTSEVFGYLAIRIANTTDANAQKHVWEEFTFLENCGIGFGVANDAGLFDMPYCDAGDAGGGATRLDAEWVRSPNPAWEYVAFEFRVPAGDYCLVDSLHVATECVPEPAALPLLAVAAVTVLAYASKVAGTLRVPSAR